MKVADWNRPWLKDYPWDFVIEVNRRLCEAKGALHKRTSDGFSPAKELWETQHTDETSLFNTASLCRRIHRLAPFCFYNGNTMVAIIRDAISVTVEKLDDERAYLFRSAIGHYVAGTFEEDEFSNLLSELPDIDTP